MKLSYDWNKSVASIKETEAMNDMEFFIQIHSKEYFDSMKRIQEVFEANTIITDVFVYTYANHEYRVVVRKDYYIDFILQLFKHRLVTKLEWTNELP